MNNLAISWERNVTNLRFPDGDQIYAGTIHRLFEGLSTGYRGNEARGSKARTRLST
jgi:hypothetical protein